MFHFFPSKLQAEEASQLFLPMYTTQHSNNSMCQIILFAKLSTIIYLTNQIMITVSGITEWRHSKKVHRLPPFLSYAILCSALLTYFFFHPIDLIPKWLLFSYSFVGIQIKLRRAYLNADKRIEAQEGMLAFLLLI